MATARDVVCPGLLVTRVIVFAVSPNEASKVDLGVLVPGADKGEERQQSGKDLLKMNMLADDHEKRGEVAEMETSVGLLV